MKQRNIMYICLIVFMVFSSGFAQSKENLANTQNKSEKEEQSKYYSFKLKLNPINAKVEFLDTNIKYYDGMILKKGRYHISISAVGYESDDLWIDLDSNINQELFLKKKVIEKVKKDKTSKKPKTPQKVRNMLENYFSNAKELILDGKISDLYVDSKIDYYKAGYKTRDEVYKDKVRYYKRWTSMKYKIDKIQSTHLNANDDYVVNMDCSFDVYNEKKSKGIKGTFKAEFILDKDSLKIKSEKTSGLKSKKYGIRVVNGETIVDYDAIVTLKGYISRENDYIVLNLPYPITALSTSNSEYNTDQTEKNVRRLQIAWSGKRLPSGCVMAKGELYSAFNGYHHTRVLISLKSYKRCK